MAHLSGNLHTAMDILSNIGHEGSFCYDTFGKLSISEGIVRPEPNAAAFSHRTANHFLGLRTKAGNRTRQQGHVAARGQLIGQAQIDPEHLHLSWPTCAHKMRMIFGGKMELTQNFWHGNIGKGDGYY